jgi:hypothetical protein
MKPGELVLGNLTSAGSDGLSLRPWEARVYRF